MSFLMIWGISILLFFILSVGYGTIPGINRNHKFENVLVAIWLILLWPITLMLMIAGLVGRWTGRIK